MSTREHCPRWCHRIALVSGLALAASLACAAEGPDLGRVVTAEEIAREDLTVLPDGTGLPPGAGSVADGAAVYAQSCIACHGERGANGPNDALVGGAGTLASPAPLRTIGSYWPYATTVFDYVRRAMPHQSPGSLTADEIYAVTAYLLYLNGIVSESTVLDARSLAAVRMPNRDGFYSAVPH